MMNLKKKRLYILDGSDSPFSVVVFSSFFFPLLFLVWSDMCMEYHATKPIQMLIIYWSMHAYLDKHPSSPGK